MGVKIELSKASKETFRIQHFIIQGINNNLMHAILVLCTHSLRLIKVGLIVFVLYHVG